MTEVFRRTWRGGIRSSEGYVVTIGSRTGIDYRDDRGQIRIDAEPMHSPRPRPEVVVYTGSIPDTAERLRAEVLERLERALDFEGLNLTTEDAWFDK